MFRAVRSGILSCAAALLLAGSASALTVSVLPSSPGLDDGFGGLCTPTCTPSYDLSGPAPVASGGTITFANNLLLPAELVTISLVVPSSLFVQTPSGPDTVTFTSVSYTATVSATVVPLGGGNVFLFQDAAATGGVSGSYAATAGGSGPLGLSGIDVNSLVCSLDASGQGTCGFTFGNNGFPVTVGGGPLQFVHTFNVVVPEPGAVSLLASAALGLWGARRRRAR